MTRSRRTAPSTPNAAGHDRKGSAPDIMAGIDRTEGDDGEEMIRLDAGSRKPARTASQSPATRSTIFPENQPFLQPLTNLSGEACAVTARSGASHSAR